VRVQRFARFTIFTLVYTILVILWGAFVRASHSGDGCGTHWPSCHGTMLPSDPTIATLIEFAHRATSGVALLLVVGLLIWSWRLFPRGHLARRAAGFTMLFMITESLIGAGIVLFDLTTDNGSVARAIFMAAHLVNTFLLLGALALSGWWAIHNDNLQLRGQGWLTPLLLGGLVGVMLLGSSGALTALANTLFPAQSLAHGLAQDFAPDSHFLLRIRIIHPLLAGALGLYLLSIVGYVVRARPERRVRLLAQLLLVLFVLQGAAGALNLVLLSPLAMQLIHLFMADMVWVTLVLFSAVALAAEVPTTAATRPTAAYARHRNALSAQPKPGDGARS
jgi:heme A synthase